MIRVSKLGFIGLSAVDRDGMAEYYSRVMGLAKQEETPDGLYFSCGPEHHAVGLRFGSESGMEHIGLELAGDGSLAEAQKALAATGVPSEIRSDTVPGIAECLRLADPDGATIYLYRQAEPSAKAYSGNGGVAPTKLGHVAYFVENAKRSERFFTENLGFRWADWVEDVFLFMRCNADHHTLNFLQSAKRGMFHFAFELRDFSHVEQTCDLLARENIPLIWGPGRHGAGHNIFIYHHDPDGNIVEYFAELDRMSDESLGYYDPKPYHEDSPQRPKVWPHHPLSGNKWGVRPPDGFGAINLARKTA